MEEFKPTKFNLSAINNGKGKYINGADGVQADTINAVVEGAAWVQALGTNQPNNSEVNNVGTPSVSIETLSDGTPRFKFDNLNSNCVKGPVETSAFINGKNTLKDAQPTFSVESNNRFDYDNVTVALGSGTFSKIENGYNIIGGYRGSAGSVFSNGWFVIYNPVNVGEIISFDYKIIALNPDQTNNALDFRFKGGANQRYIKSNCQVGDFGRAIITVPNISSDKLSEWIIAVSSMTVEITNICISKVTDTYTPYLADGTAVNVKVYNSDDTENTEITTAVGQSINITQYDNITNLSVLTEGALVSGQFILSTQYELNDKLTPLFGTFASRPTTTQPYAILYIATDQTGENKVTILPANTDGSVSGNWISI